LGLLYFSDPVTTLAIAVPQRQGNAGRAEARTLPHAGVDENLSGIGGGNGYDAAIRFDG
jgi:hypothetical protein